jgi:hypothetical protein
MLRRWFWFLPLLGLCAGCASGVYVMREMESAPAVKAEPGKAALVTFRSIHYGQLQPINVWMDRKFIGQTKGHTYFITQVKPGEHTFVAEAGEITGRQAGCVKLKLSANKVYYLWQGAYPGPSGITAGFSGSNPQDFKKELENISYSEPDPAQTQAIPVLDEEIYRQAEANYEQELKDNPERYKDTLNIQGF